VLDGQVSSYAIIDYGHGTIQVRDGNDSKEFSGRILVKFRVLNKLRSLIPRPRYITQFQFASVVDNWVQPYGSAVTRPEDVGAHWARDASFAIAEWEKGRRHTKPGQSSCGMRIIHIGDFVDWNHDPHLYLEHQFKAVRKYYLRSVNLWSGALISCRITRTGCHSFKSQPLGAMQRPTEAVKMKARLFCLACTECFSCGREKSQRFVPKNRLHGVRPPDATACSRNKSSEAQVAL